MLYQKNHLIFEILFLLIVILLGFLLFLLLFFLSLWPKPRHGGYFNVVRLIQLFTCSLGLPVSFKYLKSVWEKIRQFYDTSKHFPTVAPHSFESSSVEIHQWRFQRRRLSQAIVCDEFPAV